MNPRRLLAALAAAVLLLAGGCTPGGGRDEIDALHEMAGARRWSELEVRAERVLAGRPAEADRIEALLLRGLARSRLGRCQEALVDLEEVRAAAAEPEPARRAGLEAARCLSAEGRSEEALGILRQIAGAGGPAERAEARLAEAGILLAGERVEEAAETLADPDMAALDPGRTGALAVQLARLEMARNEFDRAEARLQPLAAGELAPDDRAELGRLRAVLAEHRGDLPAALEQLHDALGAAGEPAPAALVELARAVSAEIEDPAPIDAWLSRPDLPDGLLWPLERRRIELLVQQGDLDTASRLLEPVAARLAGSIYEPEVRATTERLRLDQTVHPRRIGLLLPLEGRLAVYSLNVIKAATMAADEFNRRHPGDQVELVRRDLVADDPEAAFVQLALEDRVVAVIGPLLSETTRRLAPAATELGLPLISPAAPAAGVPETSPYVFRCSLTPEAETRALVDRAVYNLGLGRFCVLHPETPGGIELRDAFLAAATDVRGEVLAVLGYPDGTADFSVQMNQIQGLGFDGLFVADSAAAAGLIAPQLLFHDIKEVLLLGTSAWNDPRLVEVGGPYVEDAVFPEAFHAGPGHERYTAFCESYRELFGELPDRIACQAYEAAWAVLAALEEGAHTRGMVRRRLADPAPLPGLMGPLVPAPDGDLERVLVLLTVASGRIVELDWEYLPFTLP